MVVATRLQKQAQRHPSWPLTIIRQIANWQYGYRTNHACAGERATASDPGMAQGSEGAFSAASRWRSGQGRGLRPTDRQEVGHQSADGERASEDFGPGAPGACQAHQAMDVLQAR